MHALHLAPSYSQQLFSFINSWIRIHTQNRFKFLVIQRTLDIMYPKPSRNGPIHIENHTKCLDLDIKFINTSLNVDQTDIIRGKPRKGQGRGLLNFEFWWRSICPDQLCSPLFSPSSSKFYLSTVGILIYN